MPRPSQTLAVTLAFIAAAVSLGAAAVQFFRGGSIRLTPLVGGLLMLALGIAGYRRLKDAEQK
jgi:hypothetical protein